MRLLLSPLAGQDIREAYEYVAKESPEAAERVLLRIVEVIAMLASGAVEGRTVMLRDGRRVQTWPAPPHGIYYRKTVELFEVVRVYHQARRPIEQ